MGNLKTDLPATSNVVKVTVPSSVAYNFDQMTQLTQKILNRFGCGMCHSGRVIIFNIEDTFQVDPELNITAVPSVGY
jgi:hypothetical protein